MAGGEHKNLWTCQVFWKESLCNSCGFRYYFLLCYCYFLVPHSNVTRHIDVSVFSLFLRWLSTGRAGAMNTHRVCWKLSSQSLREMRTLCRLTFTSTGFLVTSGVQVSIFLEPAVQVAIISLDCFCLLPCTWLVLLVCCLHQS